MPRLNTTKTSPDAALAADKGARADRAVTPRWAATAALVLLGSLTLSGCAAATPAPSATLSAPAPSASETSAATPPAEAASVPMDCRSLVSADRYDDIFLGTPLNDPGTVDVSITGVLTPTAPPEGASPEEILAAAAQLRCIWRDPGADITSIAVTIARVDVAVADAHLDEIAASGYTCTEAHSGRACQLVQPNDQYPVDEAFTYFLRDDVYISVVQANFPTDDLLGDMASVIWG